VEAQPVTVFVLGRCRARSITDTIATCKRLTIVCWCSTGGPGSGKGTQCEKIKVIYAGVLCVPQEARSDAHFLDASPSKAK
jgi:hypothetical protein